MRMHLITAASVLALTAGAAMAQGTGGSAGGQGSGGGMGQGSSAPAAGPSADTSSSGATGSGVPSGPGAGAAGTEGSMSSSGADGQGPTPGSDTATTTDTTPPASGGMASERPVATTAEEALAQGDNVRVERMIGASVVGSDGEEIGEVEDVILDAQSGGAKQLIVASGGFLGIGEKQIAINYSDVTFDNENQEIRVSNLTRQSVDSMAEYEYEENTTSFNRRETPATTTGAPATAPAAAPTRPATE